MRTLTSTFKRKSPYFAESPLLGKISQKIKDSFTQKDVQQLEKRNRILSQNIFSEVLLEGNEMEMTEKHRSQKYKRINCKK